MLKHHPKLKKIQKEKGIKSKAFKEELHKVLLRGAKKSKLIP